MLESDLTCNVETSMTVPSNFDWGGDGLTAPTSTDGTVAQQENEENEEDQEKGIGTELVRGEMKVHQTPVVLCNLEKLELEEVDYNLLGPPRSPTPPPGKAS